MTIVKKKKKNNKERKLSLKEKQALSGLKKEARDRQAAYRTALQKLVDSKEAEIGKTVRDATEIVSDADAVFQKEKVQIDKWKKGEQKRVELKYQDQLSRIRTRKSSVCSRAENGIEVVRVVANAHFEAERKQLDRALDVFLADNRKAQELIKLGAPTRKEEKEEKKEKEEAESPEGQRASA